MSQPLPSHQKPIKERLEKAIMTLHALPHNVHTKPIGHKSAWPDMIRQAKKGAILHRGSPAFCPNNQDISYCYDIIDALYDLSEMQRLLIWARAMNVAWRPLQNRFNRSRTHLNRLHMMALTALEARLKERSEKNSR